MNKFAFYDLVVHGQHGDGDPAVVLHGERLTAAMVSKEAFLDSLDDACRLHVDAFACYPDSFVIPSQRYEAFGNNVCSAAVPALLGCTGQINNDQEGADEVLVFCSGADRKRWPLDRPDALQPSWYIDPTNTQNLCQRPAERTQERIAHKSAELMLAHNWELVLHNACPVICKLVSGAVYPRGKDCFSLPRQWAEVILNNNAASPTARTAYNDMFSGLLKPDELPDFLWGEPVNWDCPELEIELWRRKES